MKYSEQIIDVIDNHQKEIRDQIIAENSFLLIATLDRKTNKVVYLNAGDKLLAIDALSNVGHQNIAEASFFEMISNTVALQTYKDIHEEK